MRQRAFEIIRVPELEGSSFLFNNVRVDYVGTNPETGNSFYCSTTQTYGVRVNPDGQKTLVNATTVNYCYSYVHGSADYLQFKNAFGHEKHIYVSRAVWVAAGRTIPPGYTIDHIDGCTTNNDIRNLRCITNAINQRDGGFLRKLRNKGIKPETFPRPNLLRYFDRMAILKPAVTRYRYDRLTRDDLDILLIFTNQAASLHFNKKYNLKIQFQLCPTTSKKCAD